jgi:hypothetical protein
VYYIVFLKNVTHLTCAIQMLGVDTALPLTRGFFAGLRNGPGSNSFALFSNPQGLLKRLKNKVDGKTARGLYPAPHRKRGRPTGRKRMRRMTGLQAFVRGYLTL